QAPYLQRENDRRDGALAFRMFAEIDIDVFAVACRRVNPPGQSRHADEQPFLSRHIVRDLLVVKGDIDNRIVGNQEETTTAVVQRVPDTAQEQMFLENLRVLLGGRLEDCPGRPLESNKLFEEDLGGENGLRLPQVAVRVGHAEDARKNVPHRVAMLEAEPEGSREVRCRDDKVAALSRREDDLSACVLRWRFRVVRQADRGEPWFSS